MFRAAAVRQLRDLDPAKETERAQTATALELILEAERLTGPELQLSQDDVRLGVDVADDQDVVDDGLRALLDVEGDVDPAAILARCDTNVDDSGAEAAVQIV